MSAAFTEYTHDAETLFLFFAVPKVNDGSVIVIVDMTASGISTDRTGFKFQTKLFHIGIKKRF